MEIREVIEEIINDVETWRNKCAEKYFNMIHDNGIEENDAVFELFDDLMDGFEDVDEAVARLQED